MAEVAIHMQGVTKRFGNFDALSAVDLDVAEGERVVICGPSGSGEIDAHPLHQPSRGA